MSVERVNCPETETLAAFVDGHLPAAEREQVLEHLDRCKACRELVAETAALLEDLETPAKLAGSRSLPWRGGARRWLYGALPLAASLLLVAVFWRPSEALTSETLVGDWGHGDGLAEPLRPGLVESPWAVRRGDEVVPSPQVALRLGVEIVSLRVAIQAEGASALAIGRYDELHKELEQADVAEYFPSLGALGKALTEGAPREEALAALTALETSLAQPTGFIRPTQRFDLGRWAQAGRLAAMAGDQSFFDRRLVRRFPRELLDALEGKNPGFELTAKEREVVATLAADLGRDAGPRDLAGLRGSFEKLLELGARG